MATKQTAERGILHTAAHLKMEEALLMLDESGESAASMHLDRAITELGLREASINRRMVRQLSRTI